MYCSIGQSLPSLRFCHLCFSWCAGPPSINQGICYEALYWISLFPMLCVYKCVHEQWAVEWGVWALSAEGNTICNCLQTSGEEPGIRVAHRATPKTTWGWLRQSTRTCPNWFLLSSHQVHSIKFIKSSDMWIQSKSLSPTPTRQQCQPTKLSWEPSLTWLTQSLRKLLQSMR